jgi:hypothetical protein
VYINLETEVKVSAGNDLLHTGAPVAPVVCEPIHKAYVTSDGNAAQWDEG